VAGDGGVEAGLKAALARVAGTAVFAASAVTAATVPTALKGGA